MAIIKNPLTIVQTGGEEPTTGQYLVQVIDYDGTVLKSANLDTGATFTLPNAPTHEKLIFQEWSSPVTISNNSITVVDSDITIGATYKTASGLTEFDITLTKVTGLTVTCNMNGNKNWGDGTTDSLTTHTYSNYGDYTIKSGANVLSSYIFGEDPGSADCCSEVRIGETATNIASNAFRQHKLINSITIPNTVISIGTYCFGFCRNLKSITFPSSINVITSNCCAGCGLLSSVVIPNTINNISMQAFRDGVLLTSIIIPDSVTQTGTGVFQGTDGLQSVKLSNSMTSINATIFLSCSCLRNIKIPASVTSIGNSAFSYCYIVKKYDFTSATAVPTLNDTNAFDGINPICKIVVPDALYDEWISATNWVTYADYIYKASEV